MSIASQALDTTAFAIGVLIGALGAVLLLVIFLLWLGWQFTGSGN